MAKKTAIEELQQIVRDLAITMQEVAQEHKKTEKALQETQKAQQKTEEAQQKTEEAQQKTEEAQQKTEKGLMELREAVRKQGENLDKANGGFKDKWGSFVENLVKGTLVSLLKSKGIAVTRLIPNYEVSDANLQPIAEFDLIASNGDEMVVVEVKTTLSNDKVDEFIQKIEKFDKSGFPTYKEGKKVYGAMAYLEVYERTKRAKKREQSKGEDSAIRAARKGLWLIEAPGGNVDFATIVNPADFVPRAF